MIKTLYEYFRLAQFNISPVRALKSIHLQFNNSCNLNCKWCSFVNPKVKITPIEFRDVILMGQGLNFEWDTEIKLIDYITRKI